ncbi:MAG: electron transport complex subunit RsxC [Sedimentisphaerales bacterium]|nr:electron transport complex subunit RsxC [Sedimentisphaerales bacterium]
MAKSLVKGSKNQFHFPGGVHPPDYKALTKDCAIAAGPLPKQVAVLLSQHIGAQCKPLVNKGVPVQAGQMIGKADAFVSAPVHSPVKGKVKEIALQSHAVLGRCLAVVIDVDTEGNSPLIPPADFSNDFDENAYSTEQILNAVADAGIVGMGGAGFPTRIKIDPEPPKETLIINGCECEPFITCDYRLMLERPNAVTTGIKLIRKAAGCKRTVIAIEDNKPRAIEAMQQALKNARGCEDIEVMPLKTMYPQGGERQLIKAVLDKFVPTGGIPPAIGILVSNVATAVAIAEAVTQNKPLTHRALTVTGHAIKQPGNFYVPIGTSVAELIEFCGGLTEKGAKVVMGGPMTGIAIGDLTSPITKTTGSITILTKKQIGRAKHEKRQTACIRCGRCIQACPENLNPTKIAHAVMHNMLETAQDYYMSACIECGCCSYVCPANIELAGYIKTGKALLVKQKKK